MPFLNSNSKLLMNIIESVPIDSLFWVRLIQLGNIIHLNRFILSVILEIQNTVVFVDCSTIEM